MSLGKNELMNELYNAGLIMLGAVATSMISKEIGERRPGSREHDIEGTEVSSGHRMRIDIGEIPLEK